MDFEHQIEICGPDLKVYHPMALSSVDCRLVKLLIVGNSGVGKTSIMTQFIEGEFTPTPLKTIGLDFRFQTILVKDQKCKIQIWDASGNPKFSSIVFRSFAGVHGILLVYDVTDRQSFLDVEKWLAEIRKQASEEVSILLVANRTDLTDQRVVDTCQGLELAEQHHILYMETSAKNSDQIQQLFTKMADSIIQIQQNWPTQARPRNLPLPKKEIETAWCSII